MACDTVSCRLSASAASVLPTTLLILLLDQASGADDVSSLFVRNTMCPPPELIWSGRLRNAASLYVTMPSSPLILGNSSLFGVSFILEIVLFAFFKSSSWAVLILELSSTTVKLMSGLD